MIAVNFHHSHAAQRALQSQHHLCQLDSPWRSVGLTTPSKDSESSTADLVAGLRLSFLLIACLSVIPLVLQLHLPQQSWIWKRSQRESIRPGAAAIQAQHHAPLQDRARARRGRRQRQRHPAPTGKGDICERAHEAASRHPQARRTSAGRPELGAGAGAENGSGAASPAGETPRLFVHLRSRSVSGGTACLFAVQYAGRRLTFSPAVFIMHGINAAGRGHDHELRSCSRSSLSIAALAGLTLAIDDQEDKVG